MYRDLASQAWGSSGSQPSSSDVRFWFIGWQFLGCVMNYAKRSVLRRVYMFRERQ